MELQAGSPAGTGPICLIRRGSARTDRSVRSGRGRLAAAAEGPKRLDSSWKPGWYGGAATGMILARIVRFAEKQLLPLLLGWSESTTAILSPSHFAVRKGGRR